MNCADYRNEIILLHCGELPEERAAELERHLQICSDCTRCNHAIMAAAAAFRDGSLPQRDIDVWPRVRGEIAFRRLLPPRWIAAPALSLLLLSTLITSTLFKMPAAVHRSDDEIVKDLSFFADYELWEDFEALESLDARS